MSIALKHIMVASNILVNNNQQANHTVKSNQFLLFANINASQINSSIQSTGEFFSKATNRAKQMLLQALKMSLNYHKARGVKV